MNLKPEPGEYKMEYLSRFMNNAGMISAYPGDFQRRLAAEREWSQRPGAKGAIGRYRVEPVFPSTVRPVAAPPAPKRRR